jgi:hypothetical protein
MALLASAGVPAPKIYERSVHDGMLRAIVALEPLGWHLSISHARHEAKRPLAPRYPTWDEIADARYEFVPAEVDMVMHLPPPSEYVALHDSTFHLHQHPEVET